MIQITIVPKEKIAHWVMSLHKTKPSVALGILIGGDRWTCVNEVMAATINDEIVGIATIAHRGELGNGNPTIVAIYVVPAHRTESIGHQLLEKTINYMLSKGFQPIHMDVMNSKVLKIIKQLPIEIQENLSYKDQTMDGDLDSILES